MFIRLSCLLLAAFGLFLPASFAFAEGTEQKYGYKPDSFEIKFYMQPRFTADLTEDSNRDTSFRVRRGRVYLTSKVTPNIKGRIQAEVKPETVDALM